MTLPRYRSGPASLGRFTYREAHHAAALKGVGPEPGPALYTLRLDLAQFPLEVLLRGVADEGPVALCDEEGMLLTHTNGAAASHGVRPGMSLRAARTFCPDLVALVRNPAVEQRALAELVDLLALGQHHAEPVPAESGSGVALRITGHLRPGQPDPALTLKRELRTLGYRTAVLPALPRRPGPAPLGSAGHARVQDSSVAASELRSRIVLPWAATRPREITVALQRLEGDLSLAMQMAGRDVRWVQISLISARGGQMHHGFEQAAQGGWKRGMSELRARLHREPGLEVAAVELRAGLGERHAATGSRLRAGLQ